MSNKNGILRNIDNVTGNVGKHRRISDHGLRNTGQMPNERWNGAFWVEQRMERIDNLLPIMAKDGNFSQSGGAVHPPGSFYVNDAIHEKQFRPDRQAVPEFLSLSVLRKQFVWL